MLHRPTRFLLAAIQAILGWEWLMSGGNKVLAGTFPQGLADALREGIKHNPDGWYVAFLQWVILPHSIFFGYLVQWTEIIIGMVLLSSAALLLTTPRKRGDTQHRLFVAYSIAAIIAATMGALQNINFHFWMGGWVIPFFDPSAPYNEGIDLDGLLPLFFLVVIIANLAFLQDLTGKKLLHRHAAHVSTPPCEAPSSASQM